MQSRITDRSALLGFIIIGILIAVGVFTDSIYLIAGGLIVSMFAGMFLAYPPRMAAMLFGVQIVFTTAFLNSFTVYAGPFRVGIDDLLQLWIFFLWIGAFIDGQGRVESTRSGKLIVALVVLGIIAFFRGLLAGYEAETVAVFTKTMLGYLFFFPAVWILKDRGNMRILVSTVLVASVLAALWVIFKGFVGGEGVYLRATSGLRVSSREVNVVVVGLFLMAMLLWKRNRSVPLLPGIATLLVMGAAILLGQSRALWLAVSAGVLMAFVADMSRVGKGGFRLGSMLSRVLLLVVFIAGSIAFVAAAGLLSAGDVAARS
ncbi:MAG: hypothetical protein KAS73_08955, partial [Candidatus Sabulitectum sp.]|nr:hypothetical protein [Candidatus Sabulitectum sp.]